MTEIHGKLDTKKLQNLAAAIEQIMDGVEIKPVFSLKECSEDCTVLNVVIDVLKDKAHTNQIIRVLREIHDKIKNAATEELAKRLKSEATKDEEREHREEASVSQQVDAAKASSDESSSN